MLLGTCTAKYVLNGAPPLVLAKGLMCCAAYFLVLFFFFSCRAVWNPFLECQTYYDKSQVLQANPNLAGLGVGCRAIREPAHVPLSVDSGNEGLPLTKLPPQVLGLL